MYCGDLRHEEGEQIYNQAMAYCDVHDIGTSANCLLGPTTLVSLRNSAAGTSACHSLTPCLRSSRSAPANRIQPLCYQAKVMARRGQDGFGHIWTRRCAWPSVSTSRNG